MEKLIDIINTDNERNIIQEICDNDLAKVKNTYGGKRKGSGAKPKYNEKTTTIAFRCPQSKVSELKSLVKAKLCEWAITNK